MCIIAYCSKWLSNLQHGTTTNKTSELCALVKVVEPKHFYYKSLTPEPWREGGGVHPGTSDQ